MNPYVQYMYSYPHKTAYRTLEGISLPGYAHLLSGSGNSLYLHIPFCQSKCGYCNLFSVTGQDTLVFTRYLDAVERQARQYQEIFSAFHPSFAEISIGGGTPLLLPEGLLERMFGILDAHFHCGANTALAIETAPNQTSREKLHILKQAGATRISMGIQSFSEQELLALGRQHCAETARKALALLKSFAFPCVNVDFIYGIPGQTTKSLLWSLREALSFEPDEIFLYPLYLHRGAWLQKADAEPTSPPSPFRGAWPQKADAEPTSSPSPLRGTWPQKADAEPTSSPSPLRGAWLQKADAEPHLQSPHEKSLRTGQAAYQQYQEASAFLKGEGYRQDSMRRFVKIHTPLADTQDSHPAPQPAERDFPERHRAFSECGFNTSLALGCGGRSYLGNLHFCTPYAITARECCRQLQLYMETADFSQITHGILLSEEELKRRYAIRHLLIQPGLDLWRYQQTFHTEALQDFPLLRNWMHQGYAKLAPTENAAYLTLTETGLGLSDYLGPQLISPQIQQKMDTWRASL